MNKEDSLIELQNQTRVLCFSLKNISLTFEEGAPDFMQTGLMKSNHFSSIYYLFDEDELGGKMSRCASPYQVQVSTIFQHCPQISKRLNEKIGAKTGFLVIKFDFGRRMTSMFIQFPFKITPIFAENLLCQTAKIPIPVNPLPIIYY